MKETTKASALDNNNQPQKSNKNLFIAIVAAVLVVAMILAIALSGKSDVCFIVGSSHGLSDTVKKAADMKLSFSKMTFAHGLFGVMLCEQIYRALSINAGEKYHK